MPPNYGSAAPGGRAEAWTPALAQRGPADDGDDVDDDDWVVTIYPFQGGFEGEVESDELSFARGEHLRVVSREGDDGWLEAISRDGSRRGLVPTNYVRPAARGVASCQTQHPPSNGSTSGERQCSSAGPPPPQQLRSSASAPLLLPPRAPRHDSTQFEGGVGCGAAPSREDVAVSAEAAPTREVEELVVR